MLSNPFQTAYSALYKTIRMLDLDAVAAYASRSTLFVVISFFPFMIMLLSLLQFLPISAEEFTHYYLGFVPHTIRELLVGMIDEIGESTHEAVLPMAAITALWSASGGLYALTKGMNAMVKRPETRRYWIVRTISVLYTLVFLVILLAVLLVLVFGDRFYQIVKERFPFWQSGMASVISVRALVSVIVLTAFFVLLYKTVPNRHTRWLAELPGAILSAISWMGVSYLYSLYIAQERVVRVYGSLAAVVLLLIWLYACMYIVFIGAKINYLLRKKNDL